jgi:N-methylhydantoinase A
MANRFGIDIGGTFTDFVYYNDESGEITVAKVPTTPTAPEQGCLNAVDTALTAQQIQETKWFLHGTTVGLNALLERRGATVGLLATEGFRDVLEIRRGDRDEMYNLFWTPPPCLVPRHLRLPIQERIRADGAVHVALSSSDVRGAAVTFHREGVSSVAIAFLNAYANPEHELAAERILREAGFTGAITLSHKVSGEYREYERTTTSVIDAFVSERMSTYLERLQSALRDRGFSGAPLIMRSGSGAMTFDEAYSRAFETIMSGPVAGAEGAGELSRRCGLGDLVTADVGGTSFDTCLIANGRPQLMYEGEIIGLPVQTPWVDVRSIGSGGGSIAHVDVGGLLKVGPKSAGAQPGPACYGRGGTEPTTTDAACILGMLGSGQLASGLVLDRELASAALEKVGNQLSLSAHDTARGIMTLSAAAMANAIREITVEQGIDPRGLKLLAIGGAGPLMGCLLADELEIPVVCVPPHAGNFSAWGLLAADLTRTKARTRIIRLDDDAPSQVNAVLSALFEELGGHEGTPAEHEASLDMRLQGQDNSLHIDVPVIGHQLAATALELADRFESVYERTFGLRPEEPIEIVSIRVTSRTPLPRRQDSKLNREANDGAPDQTLPAYSFRRDAMTDFAIWDRAKLPIDRAVPGPAIITEPTTTTYVDAGWSISLEPSGCIILSTNEAQ